MPHVLAFVALAFAADGLLRLLRKELPLYRRHLGVCWGGLLLAAAVERRAGPWALDAAGVIVGLAATVLPRLRSRRLGGLSWCRGTARRPEPGRLLILVADPHWSRDLVGLEEATLAHPEADWLFLGDVFDVWVGLPGMESEAQGRFLAWVAERRTRGRWVGLWMGNREYFLDRHAGAFDFMGEGLGGRLEGEGLAFEHGDLINAADWKYRLWNLVSRSGVTWSFFRLLPGASAARLAARLEARLRTTNRAYKLAFPRVAFRRAAEAVAPSTFVTGHFHTFEGEANGLALPWAYEGSFMAWREGRVEPLNPGASAPV